MVEYWKIIKSHKLKTSELETSVTDLQGQLTQRDKETTGFAKKLREKHLSSALKLALAGKVHDVDYVIKLINNSSGLAGLSATGTFEMENKYDGYTKDVK